MYFYARLIRVNTKYNTYIRIFLSVMENISKSFLILFSLLILGVLSLIYSYLMALNPIVFLNVVIWYFFSSILIIPFSFSSINKRIKFIISLLISCSVVYIVYGIKSSIFFVTYKSAIMDGGSMWFPKINLEDLFSTLISFSEYKLKLRFNLICWRRLFTFRRFFRRNYLYLSKISFYI